MKFFAPDPLLPLTEDDPHLPVSEETWAAWQQVGRDWGAVRARQRMDLVPGPIGKSVGAGD